MTFFGWKQRCRQVEAENARLREQNAQLTARLVALEAKNLQLVQALAAAAKNSRNSSKPPSSDIVKPPPQKLPRGQRRKIGGQPGHPKHEHPAFSPAQIDHHRRYELARCPVDASHRLVPLPDQQKIIQQVELVENPFGVTEHVAQGYWCEGCQRHHYAAFPPAVLAGGLCGPRLTSLVSYLKGKLHGSYSGIQDFFTDVLGLKVSRGYLAKLMQKAAGAFTAPYAELIALLPKQTHLNIDETGHKENGAAYWTWCFRATAFIVFKIDPSRGSDVLMDILGHNYSGSLGADFWGAYRKYARQCGVLIQFCLAHLIREVKYLCDFPEPSVQRYGRALLAQLKGLFCTLHRRAELSAKAFAVALATAEAKIWEAALEPALHPRRYPNGSVHRLIENLVERFCRHGEGYFRFITSPEIEPTNNSAEQAMRFVVMDRHMTQGTRSQRGRDFCERIWTVIATCALQKRSAYRWMHQAICAYFNGQPIPSLLLDSS
jgi:transposase